MYHHEMNWYGFGFNGFGQIVLFDKADCGTSTENHLKIVIPVALNHSTDPVKPHNATGHERGPEALNTHITACWSRTASFPAKGWQNLKLVNSGLDKICNVLITIID